jgi:hypothetical protein
MDFKRRFWNSPGVVNCATLLRREISHLAEQHARAYGLPHCLSYGQPPTVCFASYDAGLRHGNFLPSTYKAILKNSNWRHRRKKVHAQGRKSLPPSEYGTRRELDTCTSSDALRMNVFCYPRAFRDRRAYPLLNVKPRDSRVWISSSRPTGQWKVRPHGSRYAAG